MSGMPVIPVLPSYAGEVRTDPSRAEQMGAIMGILSCLGNRTPAKRFARDRPHILRMAIPAPLTDIHLTPMKFIRSIVRDLNIFSGHDILHQIRPCFSHEPGRHPLDTDRQEEKSEPGDQKYR